MADSKKGMTKLQAEMCLLLVTFFWGITYILMDLCTEDIDAFTLNALRFLIGGGLAFLLAYKRVIKHFNLKTLKYGIIVGLFLVGTYVSVTFGVQFTTVSNSGFLCTMTVVFTPIVSILYHKVPDKKTLIAAGICIIGIALLTLKDDFSINTDTLLGDVLCVACAFFYAFVLVYTDKGLQFEEVEAYTFGVVQLLTVGIVNVPCAFIFYEPHLPSTGKVWAATLFLAVLCTGLAYIIQPIAQQYTSASRVSLIFALEPVFNAVAAFVVLHEVLTVKSYIGAIIMMSAIVFMELDFSKFKKKLE